MTPYTSIASMAAMEVLILYNGAVVTLDSCERCGNRWDRFFAAVE
jgi:hypothetical protein